MATKKKALRGATRRAAFDAKALSEQIGATVKEGRISEARGRRYLTTGGKKLVTPVGVAVSLTGIKKLTGQVAPVITSGGKLTGQVVPVITSGGKLTGQVVPVITSGGRIIAAGSTAQPLAATKPRRHAARDLLLSHT